MANVFGATSTTDDVLSGLNLQGKRIFVTGVSAGLGVETARSLAAHGAHVVGAARDLAKAEAATAQVRADGAGNGGFEIVELDLASLESVGEHINFDRLLGEIMCSINDFPSYLRLDDQGRFAIGYYHPMQDFFTRK